MLQKVILIIDKRKEISTKYRKALKNFDTEVFVKESVQNSIKFISQYQPDLIIVSDSLDENITNLLRNLRLLTYNFRPTIVCVSKSSHLQDRLNALNEGADDFWEEPILTDEFKARINAHLRRQFENSFNSTTNLYNSKISYKTFNRIIAKNNDWAALLIDIENFEYYKEIYGELPANKMLQAFIVIINQILSKEDYLGQLSEKDFFIITNQLMATQIAKYIIQLFDIIVPKFYSELDVQNNYILLHGDDKEGKKYPLVSTKIGIISNKFKKYSNLQEAVSSLIFTNKLAKSKEYSNYVEDIPQLQGENSIKKKVYNNKIYIIEPDEALALMLESNFLIRNYNVKLNNSDFSFAKIKKYNPALVFMDINDDNEKLSFDLCKKIKEQMPCKILLTTAKHNKSEVLSAGADFYMPKPYEILNLINWVENLIENFNK